VTDIRKDTGSPSGERSEMKKESNSKTNGETKSKKEKTSLDALEMISGGTSHSPAKKETGLLYKK
jgi:hypothetical protein